MMITIIAQLYVLFLIYNPTSTLVLAKGIGDYLSQKYTENNEHSRHLPYNNSAEDSMCGIIHKQLQTLIISPTYPNAYSPNTYCEYTFKSPFVCKSEFHIQFLDFSLEPSPNCVKDRLEIGNSEKLCGKVIGIMKYKAMDGILKIKFTTDQTVNDKGFKILVTRLPCIDEQTLYTNQANDLYLSKNGSDTVDKNNKQYLPPTGNGYLPPSYNGYQPSPPQTGCTPNIGFNPNWYQPQQPGILPPNQFPTVNAIPNPNYNFLGPQNSFPNFYFQNGYPCQQPPNPFPTHSGNPSYVPNNVYPQHYDPTETNIPQFDFDRRPQINPVYLPDGQPCNPNHYPANFPRPSNDEPIKYDSKPNQAQIIPSALPKCCRNIFAQRRFYLANAGFPSRTGRPTDCLFLIERHNVGVCRLRIDFRFFFVGNYDPRFGCADNFVEIDGRRICGCNSGMRYVTQWGYGPKVIRYRNNGMPIASGGASGILFDVVQEDCPARLTENASGVGNSSVKWDRSDEPKPSNLHKIVDQTNSTTIKTFYFYGPGDNERNGVASKEAGNELQDIDEQSNSRLFFPSLISQSADRCLFDSGNWLKLSIDPLWLLRPRC